MTVYEYKGGPLDGTIRDWPDGPSPVVDHPIAPPVPAVIEPGASYYPLRVHRYRKHPLGFLIYEGEH